MKSFKDFLDEMMVTGSDSDGPGCSETSPPKGPTAGFSPVMGKMRKRYVYGGKDSRKRWMT